MADCWNFVLSIFTDVWTWLSTWNYHGVPFSGYIIGIIILGILIDRIIG